MKDAILTTCFTYFINSIHFPPNIFCALWLQDRNENTFFLMLWILRRIITKMTCYHVFLQSVISCSKMQCPILYSWCPWKCLHFTFTVVGWHFIGRARVIATQLPPSLKQWPDGSRHRLKPVRTLFAGTSNKVVDFFHSNACLNSIFSLWDKNVLRVCLGLLMNIPPQLGKHTGACYTNKPCRNSPPCVLSGGSGWRGCGCIFWEHWLFPTWFSCFCLVLFAGWDTWILTARLSSVHVRN